MVPNGATSVEDYGGVGFAAVDAVPIVSIATTLLVPATSPPQGELAIWPGLQPDGPGGPVGVGVLQPVLSWGPTCGLAPDGGVGPLAPYASWYAFPVYTSSGQETQGALPDGGDMCGSPLTAYTHGFINVMPGDTLKMTLDLMGTTWRQTITDNATGQSVALDVSLDGQAQTSALFSIEVRRNAPNPVYPTGPVQFTSTVITFSKPTTVESCQPRGMGLTDTVSTPVLSVDGTHCCVASMTLRTEKYSP